jgi:hypothetical protein
MTCFRPEDFSVPAIERIAHGLLDLTLPYAEWGHAAHFAAALWLLRHPGVLEREGGMAPILRRYNKAAGVPEGPTRGYHETITRASMRAASHWLERHLPGDPLDRVLASLMAAEPGKPKWLLAYWRESTLMSPEARRAWVEPDLAALPF